jgi:serine/threonine protein kinase
VSARTLIRRLELPYAALRTLYEGGCEVRLYRNEITGGEQVGKRICALGLDEAVAFREAKLLQAIRHENLVPVFDVALLIDDPDYPPPMRIAELIMPFFERGSVYDAQKRGERFSVVEAYLHVQAALRGLGELHEGHGILHRDLKSPNVFLADDGSLLKVGDLGVAIPMDPDGTAEAYPSVQLYTPPETFTAKRVDRRSDVYSMGLLLLELVNGPVPCEAYTTDEMQRRLGKGRPAPRPADLALGPHVPARLRTVIHRAMHAKPAERYASCRAMSEVLAGAPLIDWRQVQGNGDVLIWEGASAQQRDRRFRVEARKRRGGRWTISAFQQVNRWQRFVPDQILAEPTGSEATAFFDQVLKAAFRR